MLNTAKRYLSSGLSVLPARKDTKRPAIGAWSLYQERLPFPSELERFNMNLYDGICLVCGKVSGNLEVIDFDCGGAAFPAWAKLIPLELGKKLVIESTQSGGYHIFYRTATPVPGNLKLACGVRGDKKVTLIETRGEGGLVLCSPGKGYTLKRGELTALSVLTEDERNLLIKAARSLDESTPDEKVCKMFTCKELSCTSDFRPGDEYNKNGDIISLLQKHNWRISSTCGSTLHLTRPGKSSGTSATLRDRILYVFSSNAFPFEMNTGYTPFHVYTLLEHNGDFSSAARALAPPESHVCTVEKPVDNETFPWRSVNNFTIQNILKDTLLGRMCDLYASATNPPLPLEVALIKSVVTAGTAMSSPLSAESAAFIAAKKKFARGAELARLRLNTAGGQVCNVYALTVGNPASGKDIGNLLEYVASKHNWMMGTSGSAEGIIDALVKTPNGLQVISELKNYLDPKHYQGKAADIFTELFSKGFFKYTMSQRGGEFSRESDCCFPNLYANIQPEIFAKYVRQEHLDSGFLSRFIMVKMPRFLGRPTTSDLTDVRRELDEIATVFYNKQGSVAIPENYLGELNNLFAEHAPEKTTSSWRRLVNEYGPRFAAMLSVTRCKETHGIPLILTDRCWEGAEKLVQYFFNHAEKLLYSVSDDQAAAGKESILRRILKVIVRFGKEGARWGDISNYASYGTTKGERFYALSELIDRQWVVPQGERQLQLNGKTVNIAERYFAGRFPAGVMV